MDDLRYPIGTFDFEKEVPEKQISSLIDQIEELPELLIRSVGKLTDEQLDTPYRQGGWTIRQLVHHLADSNMNAYIRIKLAMTEDKPTIKPYDEALWAELDDSKLPIELSTKLLEGLHKRWVALLRSLSSSGLNRELVHPDVGLLTIKKLIDLYAWHGNHHLAQITSGVSKLTSKCTMKSELKRSVCPYDCPDACGLLVEVVDGQAVKVKGDPEHPFTKGTLCPKMIHYERTVHSPQRITHPLLRIGEKGTAQFKPISWDEAIARITDSWQGIMTNYGAEAILPYSYAGTMGTVQRNCGEGFFHRMGASRLNRTICASSKGYGWESVMGDTMAPHPDEVGQSDFILLWSSNVLATNIHLMHYIREAKKRGSTVWLIDTYENPTAQIVDKVVLVRPGTDGALALGIMHILVREGWIDQEFMAEHVQGFEQLRTKVLPDYPPAKVSKITGIEVSLLEEMAAYYGKAFAPFIVLGSGLCRYGNGAMTIRTITCLPALVGAWSKPGGGLLASITTGKVFHTDQVTREDLLKAPTRIVNMNQLGSALTELSDPPIRSLYVYHSNPAVVAPDQTMVIKGLMREDLFTVVHERFMTDTARYADIILPATTSLEHSDIYRSYGHYCVQRADAVIPAVGESKSNWDVFKLLAQAMGFKETFFQQDADDLIQQLMDPPSPWLDSVDHAKLQAGRPVELSLPEHYKTTFLTPSGKIELYNPQEAEPLPHYFQPYGDNAPFYLMSAPSVYSLNSSFNERPDLLSKKEAAYLQMNIKDAETKNLIDGQRVTAFNERGEVDFILKLTTKVPVGVVVTEGLFSSANMPGDRSVNALTSQRLTDRAEGSTFYDVKVDVRLA